MTQDYEVSHVDELEELPVNDGRVRLAAGPAAVRDQRVRHERLHGRGRASASSRSTPRKTATRRCTSSSAAARRSRSATTRSTRPRGRSSSRGPGTKRGAIAAEDDTAVLAVGAKPGEVFEPSPWEDIFAAFSYAQTGEVEKGARADRGRVAAAAGRVAGPLQRRLLRGALRRQGGGHRDAPARLRARARAGRRGRARRTTTSTPCATTRAFSAISG